MLKAYVAEIQQKCSFITEILDTVISSKNKMPNIATIIGHL